MATVITQLVEQKVATDQRKAKMEAEMMAHMMQHMRMGKDSTAQCPMMKDMNAKNGMAAMPGMKRVDDKSTGAHRAAIEQSAATVRRPRRESRP
jgi:hypothetical protein